MRGGGGGAGVRVYGGGGCVGRKEGLLMDIWAVLEVAEGRIGTTGKSKGALWARGVEGKFINLVWDYVVRTIEVQVIEGSGTHNLRNFYFP